jgi:hypothetical protein
MTDLASDLKLKRVGGDWLARARVAQSYRNAPDRANRPAPAAGTLPVKSAFLQVGRQPLMCRMVRVVVLPVSSRPLKNYLRWQYSVENSLKMLIYNT